MQTLLDLCVLLQRRGNAASMTTVCSCDDGNWKLCSGEPSQPAARLQREDLEKNQNHPPGSAAAAWAPPFAAFTRPISTTRTVNNADHAPPEEHPDGCEWLLKSLESPADDCSRRASPLQLLLLRVRPRASGSVYIQV